MIDTKMFLIAIALIGMFFVLAGCTEENTDNEKVDKQMDTASDSAASTEQAETGKNAETFEKPGETIIEQDHEFQVDAETQEAIDDIDAALAEIPD